MTTNATATEPHWTIEDLAAYFNLADHAAIWRMVDKEGLPFRYRGKGTPMPGRPGQRGLYRFVPEEVRAWDRKQARLFGAEPEPAARPRPDGGVAKLHDGKLRLGRKPKGRGA